jgi:hypothetical protein
MKETNVEQILLVSLLLSFLVSVSFFLPGEITGHGTEFDLTASIREKMSVEITAFTYEPQITIYDIQNITVEITNTGSTEYDASITETIYNITNGTRLNELAVYFDSTVHLYPGNTRGYKTIFLPYGEGSYFIKVTARYGPRIKEVWGSFEVKNETKEEPPPEQNQTNPPQNQSNQTNQTNQTQLPPGDQLPPPGTGGTGGGGGGGNPPKGNITPPKGGAGGGTTTVIGEPVIPIVEITPAAIPNVSMKLEYNDTAVIYRNMTNLIGIKVTNDGRNTLRRVSLYSSYPDVFQVDVNPKLPQTILYNQTVLFLVSAYTENATLRDYLYEFDVVSQDIKANGSIILTVKETPANIRQLIELRMLNYRLLMIDISAEIEAASLRGLNISLPMRFMLSAMDGMSRTEVYYMGGDYDTALNELEKVASDIKDSVFTLGNISLRLYEVKRAAEYVFLIFLVPIALAIVLYYYRKRKNRRPRLLRMKKEEE